MAFIPTFEEAATSVHAEQEKTFTSEDHACNWIQTLETYVFPVVGKKTVDKIDSADVLLAIGPISKHRRDNQSWQCPSEVSKRRQLQSVPLLRA